MKNFKIASVIVLLCWTCLITAEDEGSKRTNLLLRRPNPRNGPLSKTTTTTTTPATKQDEDIIDDEYDQAEDLDEAEKEQHDETAISTTTTTTTEPPKKIGPIIRPFRSNDDLLLALKRRQMNIKKGKVEKPTSKPEIEIEKQETSSTPQKSTVNEKSTSRRRFGGQKQSGPDVEDPSNSATGEELAATSIKRPSRFSLRTSRSN